MSSFVPRIAYFGLPLGALTLAQAGFRPCLIALGQSDAPGTRRVRRALAPTTRLLTRPDLNDPLVVEAIEREQPEVILSWFYPRQIPEAVLRLAPRGAFGAHPSLLPRWRGPDPYFWAIRAGDRETGVSLHRLEREYDTGAVIEQVRLTIAKEDDAWRLARRLDRPALGLLLACARRLRAGEELRGEAQDTALVTLAPAPSEGQLAIDWKQPAEDIVRLVRAAAPYPGASAQLGDALVEVVGACVYEGALPRALEPADAVATPAGLVVRAGDFGVVITRVRLAENELWRGEQVLALFPRGLARLARQTP